MATNGYLRHSASFPHQQQWSRLEPDGEFLTPLQAAFLPGDATNGGAHSSGSSNVTAVGTPDSGYPDGSPAGWPASAHPSPGGNGLVALETLHLSSSSYAHQMQLQQPPITPRAAELNQQHAYAQQQQAVQHATEQMHAYALPPGPPTFSRRESSSSLHREAMREASRPYPSSGSRHTPHSSQSSFAGSTYSSSAESANIAAAQPRGGGGPRMPKPLNGRLEMFGWARATGHLVRVTGTASVPTQDTDSIVVFPPGSYNKLIRDEMELLPSDSKAVFDAWIRIQDCPQPCMFKFEGKRPATIRAHLVTCSKRAHLNPDPLAKLCQMFRAGRKEYEDEMTRLSELAKGEGRLVLPAMWSGASDGWEGRRRAQDEYDSLAGQEQSYEAQQQQHGGAYVPGPVYSQHTESALQQAYNNGASANGAAGDDQPWTAANYALPPGPAMAQSATASPQDSATEDPTVTGPATGTRSQGAGFVPEEQPQAQGDARPPRPAQRSSFLSMDED